MPQLQVFYFSLLRWLRHVRLLSRWYRYSEAEPEDMKRSLLFFSFRSTKNRFSCENEPAAEKYQAASFARKSSPSICVQADTLHQQKPRSFWQRADQLFTKSVPGPLNVKIYSNELPELTHPRERFFLACWPRFTDVFAANGCEAELRWFLTDHTCTSSACSTTAAGFVAGVAGKCLMR